MTHAASDGPAAAEIVFRNLSFFLTDTPRPELVTVRGRYPTPADDTFRVYRREEGSDPRLWERLTLLAGLAACVRLLLRWKLTREEVEGALQLLQRKCGLQALGSGDTLSGELTVLLSNGDSDGTRLYPFVQSRKGVTKNGRRTLLDDAVPLIGDERGLRPLTADHFLFFRQHADDVAGGGEPPSTPITDAELVSLLVGTNPHFQADWKQFTQDANCPLPSDWVPFPELGRFLAAYFPLVGLTEDKIRKNLSDIKSGPNWIDGRHYEPDDLKNQLELFHRGQLPGCELFGPLEPFLDAYKSPNVQTDVPALMARWLCARKTETNMKWSSLVFPKPAQPIKDDRGSRSYGNCVRYTNTTERSDLECVFVRFSLEGNPDHDREPEAGPRVRALSELIAAQHDGAVRKRIANSHPHVHPGDELVLVLKGEVVVQLENTGMWTPLKAGDYVHFTAEIPHSIWNLERDEASALIVRFFQLERHGTRRRQTSALQMIEKKMGDLRPVYAKTKTKQGGLFERLEHDFPKMLTDTKGIYLLWTRIASWVHDRTRPPQDRLRAESGATLSEESKVLDLVGLSQFLKAHVAQRYKVEDEAPLLKALREAIGTMDKWGASDTVNAGYERHVKYQKALNRFCESFEGKKDAIRCCFEGVAEPGEEPSVDTLNALSARLGIPRVLLDGYLAPPALRVVAVRGAAVATTDSGCGYDWVVPTTGGKGERAEKIKYMIPSRTLANSDISVVLLTLESGGVTAWNHHPGFEAILPISGSARVEFRYTDKEDADEVVETPATHDRPLLYRSTTSHRVRHVRSADGSNETRAIVIRFNVPVDSPPPAAPPHPAAGEVL